MADYASHVPLVGLVEDAWDAMQWLAVNAIVYRNTSALQLQQSDCQSSAGGLISRLRSCLDPDHVDMIIFLYKNM